MLKNTFLGFTDNLNPKQKARAEKTLNKLIRYNNKIITYKEFVYLKLEAGSRPHVEKDFSYWSNRLNDYTKPKDDYRLNNTNNSYNEITKTEYDFANYILENDFLNREKLESFILEEQNRIRLEEENRLKQEEKEQEEKLAREQVKKDFDNWLLDQANNYNNSQNLDIARAIFLDTIGSYSDIQLKRFLVLIDNIDNPASKEKIISWLHNHNTTSKKVFFHITGIKLPKTDKETIPLLKKLSKKDYQGVIPFNPKPKTEKQEEQEELFYRLITIPEPHFEAVQGIPLSKYNLNMFMVVEDNVFKVSEVKTGLLLVTGKTKTEVLQNLKQLIEKHSIEKIQEELEKRIAITGISPKYKDQMTA